MKKLTGILLLVLVLAFTCAFDVIYVPEETSGSGEIVQEEPIGPEITDPISEEPVTDAPAADEPVTEQPAAEQPAAEQPEPEPSAPEEPVMPEPVLPVWQGLSEEQAALLSAVYNAMTPTGKAFSGWFRDGDYDPCSWQGVTCEEGTVTGLEFEGAGFFTEFPEEILALRDLKELHMVDTLLRGPLPEDLFDDLPKLEVLELSGNFLTGEIPELPGAFSLFPMLRSITISDNLADDPRKTQLMSGPEYADIAYYQVDPYQYPETDLNPGLDGQLPSDWDRLPQLTEIDLSGNSLSGQVPDSYANLYLTKLDLSGNTGELQASRALYDHLSSLGNPEIDLDGIKTPEPEVIPTEEPVVEVPTEEPVIVIPTEEPVVEISTDEPVMEWPTETPVAEIPTEEPVVELPTEEPVLEPIPTDEWYPPEPVNQPVTEPTPTAVPESKPVLDAPQQPTAVPPTSVPPTSVPPTKAPKQKPTPIIIVVTATPMPQWYTATPQGYYNYPPQPYNPPVYPNYPQQNYYPTATPYTYYNPVWVYPTATSSYTYTYPQYAQNQQAPTAVPTQDPASLLGFTYTMTEMTENNIPMTWRFTGMRDYSITYLDANGQLYPYFAMPWTNASELCNASVCNASVQNIPDELLQNGTFSLQLRARDAAGRTYLSDPVLMQVSVPEPTPVPEPEPQRSFLGGFFHWLFGPIIRLFGGK